MTTLFISYSSQEKRWAEEVREALVDQGHQSLFMASHPDDGIHAGAKWEQTLWQRLRQSRGVVVLCTANWLRSPWCVAEAMMARERGKPVFILAADDRQAKGPRDMEQALRIPDFLKDTQIISLADVTTEEAYQQLWRGLEQEGLKDDFPLPRQPYPGLDPFQERDAAVFFGRKEEIERVRDVLNRRRVNNEKGFVLLLGASGCGKSSLVRAGLLPRLRPADDDGSSKQWVIPQPIIAGRGMVGLALSLAQAFKEAHRPKELSFLLERLETPGEADRGTERAVHALHELASELLDAREAPDGHVLLVLDQLEEVFDTPAGSPAKAALRLLLEASADVMGPLVILATMRSDFLNAFQVFPGAAERYKEITLDPMPRSRFGELIEGPAARFGLRLGPGLTQRLVEDTHYDDALPLLAFTLRKLYAERGAKVELTLRVYEKVFPAVQVRDAHGTSTTQTGVSAAIKLAADEILSDQGYATLAADDPRLRDLRRAFYSLTRIGDEGQFARRTALRSQMPCSCEEVLARFVRERLLVTGTDEDGEPTLNLTHEALFRVWDTLRQWLLQDRKALVLRAQIEEAAAEWDAENRAENRTWPDERIIDAMGEIELSGVSLDDVAHPETVRAFLGPTEPEELEKLPALGEDEDETAGSDRYGDAWRLPLDHQARARIGVRLALRRRWVGLGTDGRPDIEWCRIEAGEVTIEIRSDPADPNSQVVDTLTRAVEPFSMACYPVTIRQFEAFVEACRRNGQRKQPGLDLPADYPVVKHQARHGNHPADSVNWYDAGAYCHWLSALLNADIRLPTEFEWQLAATGGDPANIFPWGADWALEKEPWRANTFKSGLGHATAVGLYPRGASKTGVLDLAGTIFEWCSSAYEDPDNDVGSSTTSNETRVIRGGSWYSSQDDARSAYRYRYYPNNRSYGIGFRVVCSSPSLGTEP